MSATRMTEQEFIEEQDQLLLAFPKELRGTFAYYAWEKGHSSGYEEVINYLYSLRSTFKKPIEQLVERVQKEARQPF